MRKETQKKVKESYSWLVLGAILMYFSNWNWSVPVTTWLFSVFLLRFSRTQKIVTGQIALIVVFIFIGVVSMWRLLSIEVLPPSFRIGCGFAIGVITFLPFLVDRIFSSRISPFVATLLFPCSWTALEYLSSFVDGSWGALAYSQYGNLPLMQIVSVTGIWGLSFLITWLASVVNFAWEEQFKLRKIRRIIFCYSTIIVLVLIFGYGRLAKPEQPVNKVSIASISNPHDFFSRFYDVDLADRKLAYHNMKKDMVFFFNATKNAVQAGAKIIFWQEYGLIVMEENEKELIDYARSIARDENVYIAMSIGLFPLNYPEQLWQNKLIWVDSSGKVINEYLKIKPAPPLEPIVPGHGGIPILDTIYGKIASAICADLDYPNLISQAGKHHAGILIIPAQDWKAVDPLHSNMAVFRAIENGVSLAKGTGNGSSIAVDPYGHIINETDYFTNPQNPMISSLSTQGVSTIYSRIGDSFAWFCIFGCIIIIAMAYLRKNKPRIM